jgi:hypothetical protein
MDASLVVRGLAIGPGCGRASPPRVIRGLDVTSAVMIGAFGIVAIGLGLAG